MKKFRIVFMGTPQFSLPILEAISQTSHEVVAVFCQPPRSAGRGNKKKLSVIQEAAEQKGYLVKTPNDLRSEHVECTFRNLDIDVAVVAAYGLILPGSLLDVPNYGCINVHASLLPRWRGAAPVQRAIMAGDDKTGITIMQMERGLDTGPILMKEEVKISDTHDGQTLLCELSKLGARLLVNTLSQISTNRLKPVVQPRSGITYAEKLRKDDGRIDWRESSLKIDRQIRALNPWPGAWFEVGNDRIKVLKSSLVKGSGKPGTIVSGLSVACGEGVLKLEILQRPGKSVLNASEFLNGFRLIPGTLLK